MNKKKIEKICEKYSNCCVLCSEYLFKEPWGLHHLKKRSQGGDDSFNNLVPCHNRCNQEIEDFPDKFKKRGFVL